MVGLYGRMTRDERIGFLEMLNISLACDANDLHDAIERYERAYEIDPAVRQPIRVVPLGQPSIGPAVGPTVVYGDAVNALNVIPAGMQSTIQLSCSGGRVVG